MEDPVFCHTEATRTCSGRSRGGNRNGSGIEQRRTNAVPSRMNRKTVTTLGTRTQHGICQSVNGKSWQIGVLAEADGGVISGLAAMNRAQRRLSLSLIHI